MQTELILSRLEDIYEQTENVLSAISGMTYEDFLSNVIYSAAVIRFFEVIGEAAKNIPEDFRIQYPDIEWRKISGFRDVLIHNYPKVNMRQVWDLAVNKTPVLHRQIKEVIDVMRKEV